MDGGLNATPGTICGLDYMRDPKLNKGSSFTIEERQTLGIHGLLPPRVKTQEEQAGHSMRNLRRLSDPLNQYMYMVSDIIDPFFPISTVYERDPFGGCLFFHITHYPRHSSN